MKLKVSEDLSQKEIDFYKSLSKDQFSLSVEEVILIMEGEMVYNKQRMEKLNIVNKDYFEHKRKALELQTQFSQLNKEQKQLIQIFFRRWVKEFRTLSVDYFIKLVSRIVSKKTLVDTAEEIQQIEIPFWLGFRFNESPR